MAYDLMPIAAEPDIQSYAVANHYWRPLVEFLNSIAPNQMVDDLAWRKYEGHIVDDATAAELAKTLDRAIADGRLDTAIHIHDQKRQQNPDRIDCDDVLDRDEVQKLSVFMADSGGFTIW